MPLPLDEHESATAAGIRLLEKLGRAVSALEAIAGRGCASEGFCGALDQWCAPCEAKHALDGLSS